MSRAGRDANLDSARFVGRQLRPLLLNITNRINVSIGVQQSQKRIPTAGQQRTIAPDELLPDNASCGSLKRAEPGRGCESSGNRALFRPCFPLVLLLFLPCSASVADEQRTRWDGSEPSEFEPNPGPRYLTLYYGFDRDIIFFDVNLGKIMYRIISANVHRETDESLAQSACILNGLSVVLMRFSRQDVCDAGLSRACFYGTHRASWKSGRH